MSSNECSFHPRLFCIACSFLLCSTKSFSPRYHASSAASVRHRINLSSPAHENQRQVPDQTQAIASLTLALEPRLRLALRRRQPSLSLKARPAQQPILGLATSSSPDSTAGERASGLRRGIFLSVSVSRPTWKWKDMEGAERVSPNTSFLPPFLGSLVPDYLRKLRRK
ncbi:hypothetical protein B0J13DRAFT_135098 [Dactylonectria estremocensis]|uniref:Uncharacterized protein n=1 Tax=Dactylonectria estremocensis TaxID=1079267 RepID=A0A9P9E1F2_9HYPO|nr:hypothetical protein B0J13DRAFT_135098 [Dactylonectria estremocensis]